MPADIETRQDLPYGQPETETANKVMHKYGGLFA
jgi:hypothetical protein